MNVHVYEGKNINEVKEKALSELNLTEEDVVIREKEEEAGLFKSKKVKLEILTKDDIIEYVKELIATITEQMGIDVNLECKKRNNFIKINLFSNKNNILIGKAGKTVEALQAIIKHSIHNKTGFFINVILDVEDYKEKQHKSIEYLAKKTAREVASTGVEAHLSDMNSYERRIVHEALSSIKGICTESDGEEPNRHVVIKPSKE